jgi:hypothetical protein
MRRLSTLTALILGALLFAAPVAQACGELVAMTPKCPMAKAMASSKCHGGGEVPMDCCEVRSAPEPMQAVALAAAKPLPILEASSLQTVSVAAVAQRPSSAPADSSRFHGLGRYTLFSSFLL